MPCRSLPRPPDLHITSSHCHVEKGVPCGSPRSGAAGSQGGGEIRGEKGPQAGHPIRRPAASCRSSWAFAERVVVGEWVVKGW